MISPLTIRFAREKAHFEGNKTARKGGNNEIDSHTINDLQDGEQRLLADPTPYEIQKARCETVEASNSCINSRLSSI
jgi:hypothetical protein